MAFAVNEVIIGGNLTREIEMRESQGGKTYGKFSIAVNEGYGDNEKTTFINVVAFGATATYLEKYASKGDPVLVIGHLDIKKADEGGYWVSVIANRVQLIPRGRKKNYDNRPADNMPVEDSMTVGDDDIPF